MADYKSLYRTMHRDKGDIELRTIISLNSAKIARMAPTQANLAAMQLLADESAVCSEILDARAKERKEDERTKKAWKQELPLRVSKLFLNLPAAASKCGQIVVSALEEGAPLTKEELHDFCEPLRELDDSVLDQLLTLLMNEKIIQKDEEQKYHIENVCTETLLPEDPVEAGMRKYQSSSEHGYHDKTCRLILELLKSEGGSREDELIEWLTDENSIYRSNPEFLDATREDMESLSKWTVQGDLRRLETAGVIKKQPGNFRFGKQMYYFALLGEDNGS